MANTVETFTDPRSALPNTFTDVTPRVVDFISQFAAGLNALREILGLARPIEKPNGAKLVSYAADVTLQSGEVPAGAIIPYSQYSIVEKAAATIKLEKYAKATTLEDIMQYGADVAIQRTDAALLRKLQRRLMSGFYGVLQDNTAAITDTVATWQMAVSMAIGNVKKAFEDKDLNVNDVVVFANTLDAYAYLGAAGISTQTAFGIEYVQNFLGAKAIILTDNITAGTVVATPAENLNIYFVNPANAEFEKAGLKFTVDAETGLIGVAINGNYTTMVGELFAIMAATLWPEYADGIAIMTVQQGNG